MKASALVIGGGPAGLGAALKLAGAGIKVYLVEKEGAVGGWGARYVCKATDSCQQCSACLIPKKIQEVYQHPLVEILTNTQVVDVEGEPGSFQVRLQRDQTLDPTLCNACGRCLEACPKAAVDLLNPWAVSYRFTWGRIAIFAPGHVPPAPSTSIGPVPVGIFPSSWLWLQLAMNPSMPEGNTGLVMGASPG